jgi:tripartite-type tricarboxylate transporter receptor subunit TctC
MRLGRRDFLCLSASAFAVPSLPHLVWAQAYPSKPIHIIAGYPPGGIVDVYARLIAQWLSERLSQSVLVENRTGAGGSIAVDSVVRAPADGYTLLLTSANHIYNPVLYPELKYDYLRDMIPVAGIAFSPQVMVVNPSIPALTVSDFVLYAKANPGKINFASAGVGTGQHLCAELFKLLTGVEMVHVPYRGAAPAVTDLIAGQVQIMFDFLPSSIEHVRSGRLRALAVASKKRWPSLPDVPTIGDSLANFEAGAVFGLAAPKGTPNEAVERINRELNAALADSRMKTRIAEVGGEALAVSPVEFGNLITKDAEKWTMVIRAANVKPG